MEMTWRRQLPCSLPSLFLPYILLFSLQKKITLTFSLILNKGLISIFTNRNIFRLLRRFWWEFLWFTSRSRVWVRHWGTSVGRAEGSGFPQQSPEEFAVSRMVWAGGAEGLLLCLGRKQRVIHKSIWGRAGTSRHKECDSWFTEQKGLKNQVRNPANPLGEGVAWNREPLKEEQCVEKQKAEENLHWKVEKRWRLVCEGLGLSW